MRTSRLLPMLALMCGLAMPAAGHAAGESQPVAGTWGMAASLERRLERRLELARGRALAIRREIELRRTQLRRLNRDQRQARNLRLDALASLKSLREHPEIDLCAKQGGLLEAIFGLIDRLIEVFTGEDHAEYCPTEDDYEQAARYWGRRARAVAIRRERANRRVLASEQRLGHELQATYELREKARAARLVDASAVSCLLRDDGVHVQLTIRNGYAFEIQALVLATYSVRGPLGDRITVTRPRRVPIVLGPGEQRAIVVDGGPPPATDGAATAIVACSPRLADVLLSAYRSRAPDITSPQVPQPVDADVQGDVYLALFPAIGPVTTLPEIPLPTGR